MDAAKATGFELGSDGPSLLVAGIDGTDTSWRALYYAFGLARRHCGTVVAVYASAPVLSFDGTTAGAWYAADEVAAELRTAIRALSAEHHVPAEFVRTQRDAVIALLNVAAERRADAIVLGASRTLSHRFFGSATGRTIRRSRCPVIIVP
jgi:nucleotide-binding universal stress UspA family protein